jgi:DNA transformation protein
MASRNAYVDFLVEQFSPLGEITTRAMFGGFCLYCDGVVFGLVADSSLYLKADAENRQLFEQRGLQPFRPFDDKPDVMSYYEAPAEIFEDPELMQCWVGGAVEAGRRAKVSGSRRKAAHRSRSA